MGLTEGLDTAEFRKELGAFMTGVTVVTTMSPVVTPRGITANSFTSVSLEPPLILVCLAHSAASHHVFTASEAFAVSILNKEQLAISARFASSRLDKFVDTDWQRAMTGSPIIEASLAWVEKHKAIEAGDHTILIERVVGFGHTPSMPLGYFGGKCVSVDAQPIAQPDKRPPFYPALHRVSSE